MLLDESRYLNPCLTMGWESFETTSTPIFQHEFRKSDERPQPLHPKDRLVILLKSGYTADYLREHLTKPNPEQEEVDHKRHAPKKQRKGIFSRIFKKRVANEAA